jgi:hypothetical protein
MVKEEGVTNQAERTLIGNQTLAWITKPYFGTPI